ncbi:hypothetical protein B566_EDAN008673, partial [Ephemera danica]
MQPGGDRFCSLMQKICMFVMATVLQRVMDSNAQAKKHLASKMQPLLVKSLSHHSRSVATVEKAAKYAETYTEKAVELVSMENACSTELKNVLTLLNVQPNIMNLILKPDNATGMEKWKQRVEAKQHHLKQMLEHLEQDIGTIHKVSENAETLLSSTLTHVIDGKDLTPVVSTGLASKLGMTEEELKDRLLVSERLKLQGLLEVGSQALEVLSIQWAQHDMTPVSEALPQFRSLVAEAEKQALTLAKVDADLTRLSEKLRPVLSKLKHQSAALCNKPQSAVRTPNASIKASSLLMQVPFTPPFNFKTNEQPMWNPEEFGEIKLPGNHGINTESLIQVWKGEVLFSSLQPTRICEPATPASAYRDVTSRPGTCGPKRSHSPATDRPSRNMYSQSEAAPPPPKDVKLSNLRLKSASSLYTPGYKNSLHHRFLHIPSKTHGHQKEHKGIINNPTPSQLKFEDNTRQQNKHISFNKSINGDLDSSLEQDLPLGDTSLQEIAALHLSPCSPLLNSYHLGHSPSFMSPTVCPSMSLHSSTACSPLERKVLHSEPITKEADVKPSINDIWQRFQAIKLGMNQPNVVNLHGGSSDSSPI